jgi:hypothetical protein
MLLPSTGSHSAAGCEHKEPGVIGTTKRVLVFAAVAEATTGLALAMVPSLVGHLLLGEEFVGVAATVARVTGIALIGLGIACWPGPPLLGMLTYSAVGALYLAYLGVTGGGTGALLWPAVAMHAILAVLLGRVWLAALNSRLERP